MAGKGKEYSQGAQDVNRNFKVVADLLEGAPLDDLTVCGVYLAKHLISICDYIQHRPVTPPSGEGIEGRIADARNYLGILLSVIEEHKERYFEGSPETALAIRYR